MKWLRNLYARLTTPKCLHLWRPALYYGMPAKYCDLCKYVENISEASFYTIFGRPSYAMKTLVFDRHKNPIGGK